MNDETKITMSIPALCAVLGFEFPIICPRCHNEIYYEIYNMHLISNCTKNCPEPSVTILSPNDTLEMNEWSCCECDECGWEGNDNEECQKGCPRHGTESYNELGFKPLLLKVKKITLTKRCENCNETELHHESNVTYWDKNKDSKKQTQYKPVQTVEIEGSVI